MWLWGCDFHLFVSVYSNLARSDPPTQVVQMNYSVLPPLLFISLTGQIARVLNPFIMNIRSSALINPLSTNWKFTPHMFIRWFGSHADHMHQTDPPGLLRWPDHAHENSVRSHPWPGSGMPGRLQSTEWSQPCLVDTLCAQSLKPTLHIDNTQQYDNAAQYGGVERINWHPVPSLWLTFEEQYGPPYSPKPHWVCYLWRWPFRTCLTWCKSKLAGNRTMMFSRSTYPNGACNGSVI